jgi:radial spoke head protein 4A
MIVAAGAIKKLFTGDLTAAVKTYPAFPGVEAEYLRAQIARITADTAIAPAGFLVEVEAEEEAEEEAEIDPFKDEASMELYREKQLATVADGHTFKDTAMRVAKAGEEFEGHESMDAVMEAAAWVHTARPLLKQGRCSWYPIPKAPKPPPADGEEEEEEAEEEEPAEPEEPAEFGASIEGDAPLFETEEEGMGGSWAFRMCTANGGGVHGKATVVAVKSTKWPGAVTVAGSGGGHGTMFSGVYFGNGAEYTATAAGVKPFAPPLPADIQSEWAPAPVDEEAEEAPFTLTEAVDPTIEQEAEEEERLQAEAEGGVDAEEEAEE